MDYKQLIAKTVNVENVSEQEIFDLITLPKDSAMGDFCLPCFKFAKTFRMSPMVVAQNIASATKKVEFLSKVEAVGGYVNYTLNKVMSTQITLEKIIEQGENYGKCNEGDGRTVCIDYSSINIAKPFHMGHLLNTVIGGALYRIYATIGYHVVGINHLGDWGTQFGKLIVAYKLWGDKKAVEERGVKGLLDIYVKFHKEAKIDPTLDDKARYWFKQIEDGNKEALELFGWFKEITLKEVDKIYKRLNVTFDSYAGESFYNDKMTPVLDKLKAQGLLEESEGAQVVKFDDAENMPPCLLVRADGATLYATRDMAAAFYRKDTYNFYKCLWRINKTCILNKFLECLKRWAVSGQKIWCTWRTVWCRLKMVRCRHVKAMLSFWKTC
ncbi:MAG: arginine--tRNA ligase [Clostridia bacterium]